MDTNSIIVRLNIVFVVVVTLLLLISGTYNYRVAKYEMEAALAEDMVNTLGRLELSMPNALWNFDKAQIEQNLQSELTASHVRGIVISNDKGVVAGFRKNVDGKIDDRYQEISAQDERRETELKFSDNGTKKTVGKAMVFVSRDKIEQSLNNMIGRQAIQLVAMETVLLVALSYSVFYIVMKPLYKVRQALRQIAAGDADLTRRLPQAWKSEFGDVAQLFNRFVGKLHGVMQQVATISLQVAEAAEETSHINEQTNAHAQHQESEAVKVASSVENLTVQVRQISQAAAGASDAANRAEQNAQQSRTVVQSTIGSVKSLSDGVDGAYRVIEKLAESSATIGMVSGTISDIANQTNLLALNAAIEAARAGEAGRGFAVVADEVRKLSQQTQESTRRIGDVITQLQAGTQQAVEAMRNSRQQANDTMQIAAGAGEVIAHISAAAQEISRLNAQIADATLQQTHDVDAISSTVAMISRTSSETADCSAQTADASEELARLSHNLQATVDQFKLN